MDIHVLWFTHFKTITYMENANLGGGVVKDIKIVTNNTFLKRKFNQREGVCVPPPPHYIRH